MGDLSHVTAAILAGGFGTRLREAVSDRPKVLAEVNGRPFITFLLDQLACAGIGKVVLCTGYMAAMVSDALGTTYRGMALSYSQEHEPLGTGGALRQALPLLDSDPVLVMNGDSYCAADLARLYERHLEGGKPATLLLAEVPDVGRYGQVVLGTDDSIVQFREKSGASVPGLINAGVYLLARRIVEEIPPDRSISIEREVFANLLGKGLQGVPIDTHFLDIGTPKSYAAAEEFFRLVG